MSGGAEIRKSHESSQIAAYFHESQGERVTS